jgi:hypothetical protein
MNCAFKAARLWRKVRLRLPATSAAAQKVAARTGDFLKMR